ncbi:kinase-like domain-containing protein, partial [Emericellopsis atlantica]
MAQPDDPQTEPPPTARHRHFFSRLLDRAHQRGRSESVPPQGFAGSQTAPQLQSPEETTSQDQNHDPVKGAGTAPRRVSRSVVPGLPRVKTFKRQLSEDRDRLAPVQPTPEERRAVSMDRRSHALHTRHQGQTDPRASAPDNISSVVANHEPAPFSSLTLAQDTTDLHAQSLGGEPFGDNLQQTQGYESEAMTEDGSIAHSEIDEFDRMLRYELETTWILNLSMRYKDRSNREKFFVTYRESEQLWRRVTVTLDYRNAPEGSLEEELLGMKYQRDKSSKIYESIRQSLPEIQFYDTVTNLKLETTDDRLHVHVVEDGNEIFSYPPVQQVAHLGCKLVRERELLFDHHMSGFVYKVSIDNQPLIKKEIPGPETVEEFLYEINALSSLTYSDHVIKFYGLVVDDERECVKGLLISYANGGALADIIYDSCKERRQGLAQFLKERWAKQIIRGLADVHESGFVQGDFTLSNIVIDDFENAKIIDINRRGCPVGWEPPEATALIESNQRITMYIGVKSDLYQLGMVLWALAMDEDEPDREGRPLILGDDVQIADWYRKATNICLSPDPRNRLQASMLVQLLPDDPVPATNLVPADDALHATPQQEYHPDGRPRIKVNDLNSRWFSPDRSNGPSDSRGYNAWQHYAPRGRSPPSPMPSNVDCGSKSPRRFHTESAWAANRNIRPCYSDIGADEV